MDKLDANSAELRRQALERYFAGLNEMQRRAVFHLNGPLLILAGAGSGKTTVLINRVENMVLFGNAYHDDDPALAPTAGEERVLRDYIAGGAAAPDELAAALRARPVRPWNVLAITFTNKAAGELRARLEGRLWPAVASDVQASTFHSLCVRILRREIEALGYGRSFTIYDADDSQRAVRDAVRAVGLDEKIFQARAVLSAISRAKDSLLTPRQVAEAAAGDYRQQSIGKIYEQYERSLRAANALDFDDLILLTVRLFQQEPEVLERYRQRWRYIMVDEYQDTNHAQYMLISLLAGGHKNLCVVGDDDQSIYKFRGATIENILSFEEQFPGAGVIRLEQNYRSTGHILDAANAVIANNTARKGKNLWTSAGEGEKLCVLRVRDEEEESARIAETVLENVQNGARFSDHAVLYRMNAQSNAVEKALAKRAIPYRIIGGVRFYERKEIKDMIAYLSVLHNPADNLRLTRIINEPKRGIGATTVAQATEIAAGMGMSLFDVISAPDEFAQLQKKASALSAFTGMMRELAEALEEDVPLEELLELLIEKSGYRMMLDGQGLEGSVRMENIMELKSNLIRYREENEEASLGGFLEEISLYTDLDNYDPDADNMVLMTIHSAKGLEFPYVFIAGMDEGIFPGRNAMNFPPELEEERRLAYVAITRAKQRLTITSAGRRLLFGQTVYGSLSRFVAEIPPDHLELEDTTRARYAAAVGAESGGAGMGVEAPRAGFQDRPSGAGRRHSAGRAGSSTSIGIGVSGGGGPSAERFGPGDKVKHRVYGEGEVVSAKPMGGDTLLEIAFERAGTKKVMANYAKLERV